jgi:hypothetical protein
MDVDMRSATAAACARAIARPKAKPQPRSAHSVPIHNLTCALSESGVGPNLYTVLWLTSERPGQARNLYVFYTL